MVSKKQWDLYEQVKKSGQTNMFDVKRVAELSGLSYTIIREIMQDYDNLLKKFDKERWIKYKKSGLIEDQDEV